MKMNYTKVLIIDDEKDICFLLKGILNQLGYEVTTANTVKEGMAAFKDEAPGTVFLDINLPDGHGLTILPQFKEEGYDAEVIMISAYDQNREKNTAVKNGAFSFISKPFDKDIIKNVMDALQKQKTLN